jgi:pSer/pThr/pTyr-binding forkhead associated (FHA) protein
MWILESTDPDRPFTFRVLPGSIKTIGRAPRADFVVDAALVSRLHCRLTLDAQGLDVEDLGSTNGTWVNGRKIARAPLMPGDKLKVGRVEFEIRSANVADRPSLGEGG